MPPKKRMKYSKKDHVCGDPFKIHKKLVKLDIRCLSHEQQIQINKLNLAMPKRLCRNCRGKLLEASIGAGSTSSSQSSQCELAIETDQGDNSYENLPDNTHLDEVSCFREMISDLKNKFKNVTTINEKIKILTLLPSSWSREKIANEFQTSVHLARKAKELKKSKGILSEPNIARAKSLPLETKKNVRDFYFSEEISRVMPGKKDFVSLKNDEGIK